MPTPSLDERVAAIHKLVDVFRIERIVYISVTLLSLLMLLISAGFMMFKGQADHIVLTGLFGSAGTITYTTGRLLRMWNQAIELLFAAEGKNDT